MLSGEPYVEGYLRHIEEDVRSAGFSCVKLAQPIPDRAESWVCSQADEDSTDADSGRKPVRGWWHKGRWSLIYLRKNEGSEQ